MAVSVGDIVIITGNPLTSRGTANDIAIVKAVADGNGNVKVESLVTAIGSLVPGASITAKIVPVAP